MPFPTFHLEPCPNPTILPKGCMLPSGSKAPRWDESNTEEINYRGNHGCLSKATEDLKINANGALQGQMSFGPALIN